MAIRPGSDVKVGTNARKEAGSVGCFVHKDGALYFTVARHLILPDADAFEATVDLLPLWRGIPVALAGDELLDTCLVSLPAQMQIAASIFQLPQAGGSSLARTWDPGDILARRKNAASQAEADRVRAETLDVCHVGAGLLRLRSDSLRFDGQVNVGEVVDGSPQLTMTGRTVHPGDAGGPVFTKHFELVGFIAAGADEKESSSVRIVLAHHVFRGLGCELATWENRDKWSDIGALSARDCLVQMGNRAGDRQRATVTLDDQIDHAYTWDGVAVHPLQALETAYQQAVYNEVTAAKGETARREAEVEALSRYFVFTGNEPTFMRARYEPQEPAADLASVKMNFLIGTFYLFRLLVKYQIESKELIDDDLRADVSGDLTSILHDRQAMPWLSTWLQEKLAFLGSELEKLNTTRTNVIFFLKGGRALMSFLGQPEKGKNDWDTQVVINPDLPAAEWYEVFAMVHDTVLHNLRAFKAEFNQLIEARRGEFSRYMLSPDLGKPETAEEDVDDNSLVDPFEFVESQASCKAELIDVGIPRRDSPSGIEEWRHLAGHLIGEGIRYPGYRYYVNEHLFMVREAFLPGADTRKTPKRIARLGEVARSEHAAAPADADTQRLKAVLPATTEAFKDQSNEVSRLLAAICDQFTVAYQLETDEGLRHGVDRIAAQHLRDFSVTPLPPGLTAAIVEYARKEKIQEASLAEVARAVGFAHVLSGELNSHMAERANFIEYNRDALTTFVRKLYEGIFRYDERLEVELAIVGAMAAQMHREYLSISAVEAAVEPVARIDVMAYCDAVNARENTLNDPDIVLELLRPRVDDLLSDPSACLVAEEGGDRTIRLLWHEEVELGMLKYRPLVATVGVEMSQGRPLLSFIDGLPILELRRLAVDYRKSAASIDEPGMRRMKSETLKAVALMLSRFED